MFGPESSSEISSSCCFSRRAFACDLRSRSCHGADVAPVPDPAPLGGVLRWRTDVVTQSSHSSGRPNRTWGFRNWICRGGTEREVLLTRSDPSKKIYYTLGSSCRCMPAVTRTTVERR